MEIKVNHEAAVQWDHDWKEKKGDRRMIHGLRREVQKYAGSFLITPEWEFRLNGCHGTSNWNQVT